MKRHETLKADEGEDVADFSGVEIEGGPKSNRVVKSNDPIVDESASTSALTASRRSPDSHPPRDCPTGTAALQKTDSLGFYKRSKNVFRRCKTTVKSLLPSLRRQQHGQNKCGTRKNGQSFPDEAGVRSSSAILSPSPHGSVSRSSSSSLTSRVREKGSIWKQKGYVLILKEHDPHEVERGAIILFDPQCEHDLLSTKFLEKFHLSFDGLAEEPLGCSITEERIKSVGQQIIRWWAPNLNRYEDSTCRVVKSNCFDLIIGEKTITRLGIFEVRRNIIAAFMTPRPGLAAVNISETQRQATIRREQERRDKEQQEKEKKERKEKQRRDEQKAASSQNSQ